MYKAHYKHYSVSISSWNIMLQLYLSTSTLVAEETGEWPLDEMIDEANLVLTEVLNF